LEFNGVPATAEQVQEALESQGHGTAMAPGR